MKLKQGFLRNFQVGLIHTKSPSASFLVCPSTLIEITSSLNIVIPGVTTFAASSASSMPIKQSSMLLIMLQKSIARALPSLDFDKLSLSPLPADGHAELKAMVNGSTEHLIAARYFGLTPKTLDAFQDVPFSVYNAWSSKKHLTSDIVAHVSSDEDIETRALVSLLTRPRYVLEEEVDRNGDVQQIVKKKANYRSDWRDDRNIAPIMFIHANAWMEDEDEDVDASVVRNERLIRRAQDFLRMRATNEVRMFKFGTERGTASEYGSDYRIEEVFVYGELGATLRPQGLTKLTMCTFRWYLYVHCGSAHFKTGQGNGNHREYRTHERAPSLHSSSHHWFT